MVCEYFRKLSKEATSKKMKACGKRFFALLHSGDISTIRVKPLHGQCQGSYIEIEAKDVYSVMAYKNNAAVLRVAKSVYVQHKGFKLGRSDGLMFVTADVQYMSYLFANRACEMRRLVRRL